MMKNIKVHGNKGRKKSPAHIKAMSEALKGVGKGRTPWNKGRKCPERSGPNCHLWKGGKVSEMEKLRKSVEYKLWREAVFKRDNYTCVWCGYDKGRILNADHIKPFALYPELRFAIDNGRTLCIPCHQTTNTFGGRIRKYANKGNAR